MKRWNDIDSDIGYWYLNVDGETVVDVKDTGKGYEVAGEFGGEAFRRRFRTKLPVMPLDEMMREAEKWYVKTLESCLKSFGRVIEQGQAQLESMYAEEPLVDISDLAYDGDGYLHFVVEADGYALEGLYRLYDPANGPDMTLVSIDYGDRHPIIERQWERIERALYDITWKRYQDILDKSPDFKEVVVKAMETAGYTYDVLESHEGWHRFYGEGGGMGFDRMTEAAEWLDGVVAEKPLQERLDEAQERVAESSDRELEEEKGLFC